MLQLRVSFILLLLPGFASGFSLSPYRPNVRPATTATQLNEQVTLNLGATIGSESSPLSIKGGDESLINSFLKDHWNLLISAGGTRPWETMDVVTEDLRQQFQEQCKLLEVTPSSDFSVVSVKTGGISFPGLTLTSKAKIAVQEVAADDTNTRYEFVYLSDEKEIKGLPPVVWIFQKLTGGDDGGSTGQKSLTSVTYQISDETVVFKTETCLEILVTFPSILMKILPTSKEKAEEQGGSAIAKAIDKDVQTSMKALEEAYNKNISSITSKGNVTNELQSEIEI